MKSKIILLMVFCLINFFIYGSDKQKFNNANEFYKKGSFDKALELYESMTIKSVNCWFNIGNCYFKLNKFSHAIASWKKASNNASKEIIKDVEFNISRAKEKLEIIDDNNLFGEIYDFIVKYLKLIPIIYIQIIFLIFWYIFFLFAKIIVKRKFYLILTFLFLCNFALLGSLAIKHNEQINNVGIVVEKEVMVYAGPGNDYHILGNLNLSQEVKINDKKNEWLKISNHDLSGWVLINSIFIL
jgi:tetratricopeptide (TPR) repeat protein